MSDKPEAPASGEQTGSCRYRLTTDSPFYCIRDSGHDGDHAFDRVLWPFLPAGEKIVPLEAALRRERARVEAATGLYEALKALLDWDRLDDVQPGEDFRELKVAFESKWGFHPADVWGRARKAIADYEEAKGHE